ncbi:hypothetical protein G6653_06540 [Polynucleobacter paneuropaeus]|nr:hypothetical protein [Polynucleobacter paneuropaeus]MBT8611622.1 hypothetical protein [Polynucleobacter paneuropaeus]
MKTIRKLTLLGFVLFMPFFAFAQATDPSSAECFSALESNSELQVLKGKVALGNVSGQTLEILANDKKPSPAEKSALAKWDSSRQPCIQQSLEWSHSHYAPNVAVILERLISQFKSNLVDLYAGKITYGQFAKARQANADNAKAEAVNLDQQNQNANAQNKQRQQQLNQQAQQAEAQNQAQRNALATQMILNIKPYQAPFVPMQTAPLVAPHINSPTNTNCQMIGNTMNCTSY